MGDEKPKEEPEDVEGGLYHGVGEALEDVAGGVRMSPEVQAVGEETEASLVEDGSTGAVGDPGPGH